MIVLGIESSCDETSAALLQDGKILQNAIYSQAEHAKYGGVVPEVASRAHLDKIDKLTYSVLDKSSLTLKDIDLIAVTDSPGLAGALLVGISFALGLHVGHKIPITGINHLEGHICSIFLAEKAPEFPFLALVVSGGHTAIYHVAEVGAYTCLGQTVDDAAGEAFDKIGKMLGFAYPAGRAIEEESLKAPESELITFPKARVSDNPLDFSFSGLKTAVKYYLAKQDQTYIEQNRALICKSFQQSIIDSLVNNLHAASKQTGVKRVALVGGVACNKTLRGALTKKFGDQAYFPAPSLCTDNAAMIAYAGYKRAQQSMMRFPHMDPASAL